MAQTLESFVNDVIGEAPLKASGVPWYNPAGDCIHYHWRDDEFYRDWMDDKLTVYRSHKNDEAVGCEIKGIHALLDKMGDIGISVNHKTGVPLAIFLFISHIAAAPSDEKIIAREKNISIHHGYGGQGNRESHVNHRGAMRQIGAGLPAVSSRHN